MDFVVSSKNRYYKLAYIGFALLMSVLFDIFFWNKDLGLGFFIFVLLYLVGFISLAMITNQPYNKKALFLLVPILVLSFDVVIYNNELVTSLVPLSVIGLVVLFTFLFTLRNTLANPFDFRNIPLVRRAGLPFSKWVQILRDLLFFGSNDKNDRYKKIAFGILVSVPLLLIFGALFSQADAVFAQWFKDIFSFNFPTDFWPRVIRTVIFTLYLASLLYVVFDNDYTLGTNTYSVKKFDTTIVATVLALVNVLFLLFVFIQIRYLFGSSDFVLANGLTFADYARAGFFQLTAVLVLSGCLLALLYRSYSAHGHDKFGTILKILLIVQVEIIAISALRRMNLYQAEYGFTTLRLYVEWFIYFVMILFVAFAFCIARQVAFRKLFFGALIYSVIAFAAVASINVDYVIAKENLNQFSNDDKRQDLIYLINDLSVDAMPAVYEFFKTNPEFKIKIPDDKVQDVSSYLERKNNIIKKDYSLLEFNWGVFKAKESTSFVISKYEAAIADVKKFITKRAELLSNKATDCNSAANFNLSVTADCFEVLINGKRYIASLSHATRLPGFYQLQVNNKLIVREELIDLGIGFPDLIKNQTAEFYILKNSTYAYIDSTKHIIKIYKPSFVNGKPALVEVNN